MRLQLDAALTGSGITGAGETGQTAPAGSGAGFDSRRIGGDSAGADSIQISGAAGALNLLSSDRAARIQQLTAQVQTGSYNVSGPRVSQAIVGHAVSSPGFGK